MAIFLGVHDFGGPITDEQMKDNWKHYSESAKKQSALPWKVYYSAKDGKSWCITEADSADMVNKAHNDVNLPTKALYEVQKLG